MKSPENTSSSFFIFGHSQDHGKTEQNQSLKTDTDAGAGGMDSGGGSAQCSLFLTYLKLCVLWNQENIFHWNEDIGDQSSKTLTTGSFGEMNQDKG